MGSGCTAATVLCFSLFDFYPAHWQDKNRRYSLAEENTSLFDYVHDNNFCLVVVLFCFYYFGMFQFINIVYWFYLFLK